MVALTMFNFVVASLVLSLTYLVSSNKLRTLNLIFPGVIEQKTNSELRVEYQLAAERDQEYMSMDANETVEQIKVSLILNNKQRRAPIWS